MRNKVASIMSYITEHKIDLAFIQETWLRKSDGHLVSEIKEYGYELIIYRKKRKLDFGGGVALLYCENLKVQNVKTTVYKSFEHIACKVMTECGPINFINVYRPEYTAKNRYTVNFFLSEFTRLLSDMALLSYATYYVGDYNIHVELLGQPGDALSSSKVIKQRDAIHFKNLLDENSLHQMVLEETHEGHGTLDLLIAHKDHIASIQELKVCEKDDVCKSDHFAVGFCLDMVPLKQDKFINLTKRDFSSFDINIFKDNIKSECLLQKFKNCNLDDCVKLYNVTLKTALDSQCPANTMTVRSRSKQKWFNQDLRDLKREKRATERMWKKHKNAYWKHKLDAIKLLYKNTIFDTRSKFYYDTYEEIKSDLKKVYKTTNYLTGNKNTAVLPSFSDKAELANDMSKFFKDKIDNIRKDIETCIAGSVNHTNYEVSSSSPEPIFDCPMDNFKLVDSAIVKKVIKNMNNKGHPNDPVPVWIVKECLDELADIISEIANRSFSENTFPDSLKHAIVRPTIKDSDGDKEDFKNYRPVSNLTFLSKVLEKLASIQLQDHLSSQNLYPESQSAYRKGYSCETALLKVVNDIQKEVEKQNMVALVMLDLSSAFDTIDKDLLLEKLENDFGFTAQVLNWLESYLSFRTFSVRVVDVDGARVLMIYGVPQGSILGPLLFVLYVHDLVDIAKSHGFKANLYADDSSIYVGFNPLMETTNTMLSLQNCISDIQCWMNKNFLKINIDKTQVIFFGRYQELNLYSVEIKLGIKSFKSEESTVKSLGVILDSKLSMNAMVSYITKTCYNNLKKLQSIRFYIPEHTKIMLIKSLIISRIDYCSILLVNVAKTVISRLQRIINAAVRFVYKLRRSQSVREYVKRAHILPMESRIKYKCCITVFKIIHGLSAEYLTDMINPNIINRTNLRSGTDTLILRKPGTVKCIEHGMIENWNSLPKQIRHLRTIDIFEKELKTYFFQLAYV